MDSTGAAGRSSTSGFAGASGASGNGGAGGSAGSGAIAGTATAGAPSQSGSGGQAGVAGVAGAGGSSVAGASGAGGSGGATDDPNVVDVYLVIGQSNATGQGYSKNLPAGFTLDPHVQLYHSADIDSGAAENSWISLRPASEGTDGCNLGLRFGPELGFGNHIRSFHPNRRIFIIKHAKSGTNLHSQWAPGTGPSDTAHFGPEFKTFVDTVDGGLKALKDQGLKPLVRAALWQQGEADANDGGQDYGANLQSFIARLREQWSTPSLLFVYGYVYPASNFGTGRDLVRAAQKNIDQDSGDALATEGAFVVETDDLSLRASDPGSCYPDDKIHFGTAGQLELGKRMAVKVRDNL